MLDNGKISTMIFNNYKKNKDFLNGIVKSKCREILVSNYLKNHCESFETFLKAIR